MRDGALDSCTAKMNEGLTNVRPPYRTGQGNELEGAVPSVAALPRATWRLRLVSWTAAIPIGFVAAAVPAYASSLLTRDDLLDVFVETGYARFEHVGLVVLAWAVVTAAIAHVAIEVGRHRRTPHGLGRRPDPSARSSRCRDTSHE
jgi:hypothetical protein